MGQIIQKAATLVEAFPYIRSFRDKIVVVKYGGSTQPDEGGSDTILADLVFMETVGMRPVVVHGGGKEISRRLEEEGVESSWVNGLRVPDEATMRVVEETLFGVVNRRIVDPTSRGPAPPCSGYHDDIVRISSMTTDGSTCRR